MVWGKWKRMLGISVLGVGLLLGLTIGTSSVKAAAPNTVTEAQARQQEEDKRKAKELGITLEEYYQLESPELQAKRALIPENGAVVKVVNKAVLYYAANLPENYAEEYPSEDGRLYLYALNVYEYEPGEDTEIITSCDQSDMPVFYFCLNRGRKTNRLYKKFGLAVKKEGKLQPINNPVFLSDPEKLASYTHERIPHTLKGLQGQDFWNIPIVTANNEDPHYLTRIVEYICYGTDPKYINPLANGGDSHRIKPTLYMLNANDAGGVDLLVEKFEYYAKNADKTDDWIIGNEVNVRLWNYITWQGGWDEYIKQYVQVYRIAYLAIKSCNANANVYICLDQNWNRDRPTNHGEYYEYIDGKDFLVSFDEKIKANGNIDWGLSLHPYTVPLTYAKFWDMSGCSIGGYAANMINGDKMVSFQNLGVITRFMEQESMRNPDGDVRHITISELGLSSTEGGKVQAAALCAAYMAALRDPYVEDVVFVNYNGGGVSSAFTAEAQDMYDHLEDEEYQKKAMQTIGISDWSQILR